MKTLEDYFQDLVRHLEKTRPMPAGVQALYRTLFFAGAQSLAVIIENSGFSAEVASSLLQEIHQVLVDAISDRENRINLN